MAADRVLSCKYKTRVFFAEKLKNHKMTKIFQSMFFNFCKKMLIFRTKNLPKSQKLNKKIRLMQKQSILFCFLFKSHIDSPKNKNLLMFFSGVFSDLVFHSWVNFAIYWWSIFKIYLFWDTIFWDTTYSVLYFWDTTCRLSGILV